MMEISDVEEATEYFTPRKPQTVRQSPSTDRPRDSSTSNVPAILRLNVGGKIFMTHRSTLCKYNNSLLAAMFSGRHTLLRDENGAFFIDRNGDYFGHILEFLRCGILPPNNVAEAVYKEALYYLLEEMELQMVTIPSIASLIVKENHRNQFPDYKGVKKRIVQIAMENALVTKVGEVLMYAFRTEFVARAANFNQAHPCAADQAHISIGPWESIVDEETFIKCIENDLIAEGYEIKCHEGKRRCKYFYGQSCPKCVFRIQISFDHQIVAK